MQTLSRTSVHGHVVMGKAGHTAKAGVRWQHFCASDERLCGLLCTKGWIPPVQFILSLSLKVVACV